MSREWMILLGVVLLLHAAASNPCPPEFDGNCIYCSEDNDCLYCKAHYYLNQSSPGPQFCYPCQDGCEKCYNKNFCTSCQEDFYYIDANNCIPCDEGCMKCTANDVCDACDDKYVKLNGRCSVLKVQVYIVGACLAILLVLCVVLLVIVRRRPQEVEGGDQTNQSSYGKAPSIAISKKVKYSFVLDEESKKDLTKVNDKETIGELADKNKISFIESVREPTFEETLDKEAKKKKVISFLQQN